MKQHNQYHKGQVFLKDFDRRYSVEIRFEIERVNFHKNGFSIITAHVISNNQNILFPQNKLSVKGTFPNPKKGDTYWARGKIGYSDEYGYHINVKNTPEIIYPRTREEIIKYIKDHIKGLGVVRATKIVDALGPETLSILSTDPDRLRYIQDLNLPEAIINEVSNTLVNGHVIDELLTILSELKSNIDDSIAFKLFDRYGVNSVDLLSKNPYIIADINPIYWPAADKMYHRKLLSSVDSDTDKIYAWKRQAGFVPRIRTAVKYYLKLMLEYTGSLTISLQTMRESFRSGMPLETHGSFIDTPALKDNFLSDAKLDKHINDLIEEGSVVKTFDSKGDTYLYLKESYRSEQRLIKNVKKFIKTSTPIVSTLEVNDFINKYEEGSGFTLAKNQRLAVDLLVNNRISILTGGPGTGKTQTLKVIRDFILYLESSGKIPSASMSFLAPTGKAAKRMSEVLKIPTSTIHRKLKLKGFNRDEDPVKIEEKYIIVDEFSMVDIHLASLLFNSIEMDAHILLVGDEHQLPSIGPGLVLRDLIESNKVKTVMLNEVFRQESGSQLIANANKIRDGIGYYNNSSKGLVFNQKMKDGISDTYFIESVQHSKIKNQVLSLIHKLTTKYHYQMSDIMVITAQNSGSLGRKVLNELIQFQFNSHQDFFVRESDNTIFKVGDPIMQQVNDYDFSVFNGEVGEVEEINEDSITIRFDDERVLEYNQGLLRNIDLAYAITIHKSQGSQSPVVIQIVDKSQQYMLNRSLVYTGYTRTEEMNILIGQYDMLNRSIQNTSNIERMSLISDKI